MSRKYISTAVIGDAHKSDILGVAVTKAITVSCSSDGYIKVWDNTSKDRSNIASDFVDKVGLHHVTALEDVVDGIRRIFVGCVSFSGRFYLYQYHKTHLDPIKTNLPDELTDKKCSFWACKMRKGNEGNSSSLALTVVTGETRVFDMNIDESGDLQVSYKGYAFGNDTSIATSIDIDTTEQRLAVGHQDGSVYLYDLEYLKLLYSFGTYGTQSDSVNSGSLSTVRCIEFSPKSGIMAVARDSGPYGTVVLYDIRYGESVGTLKIPTHSANVGIGSYAHKRWCMSVSFNDDGTLIATGGLENGIRVWNVETKESEALITISNTDADDSELGASTKEDEATCCSLSFIEKGATPIEGSNDGLVIAGFDRTIRWYREAGGI